MSLSFHRDAILESANFPGNVVTTHFEISDIPEEQFSANVKILQDKNVPVAVTADQWHILSLLKEHSNILHTLILFRFENVCAS